MSWKESEEGTRKEREVNEKPDAFRKFNSISTMKNLLDALWNVVFTAEKQYCDGHHRCKTGDECALCGAVRMVREIGSRNVPICGGGP